MKQNSQLSDVLHVLLHMAEGDGPATRETLATGMQTNPVVLRRPMGGLRNAGFVVSEKGHGGGGVLSCALDGAAQEAEALLLKRFGVVTLASVATALWTQRAAHRTAT
jgi:hypothetical protein